MKLKQNKNRVLGSRLFHDSSWAVFGNGIGNGLLLLSGILIARLLGRDIYGEYGFVKTTMLTMSGFATFGLAITATRYIAQAVEENSCYVNRIIADALKITFVFSLFIAVFLFIFAQPIAIYLNEEQLVNILRLLGIIIIAKAISTTQNGILAGYKKFDTIAKNTIKSSMLMVIGCVPLTYLFGLNGALGILFVTQAINVIINAWSIRKIVKVNVFQLNDKSYIKELTFFSLPVALQECSFTAVGLLEISFLAKLSTMGEVGLFTAASQWNAVVLMIPGLLNNIILSYLSGSVNNQQSHSRTMRIMLLVNFSCTIVPLLFVLVFSDFIVYIYGSSFNAMKGVLSILVLSSVFECCANVYRAEYIAIGRTWLYIT